MTRKWKILAAAVMTAVCVAGCSRAEKKAPPRKVVVGVDFSDIFSSPLLVAHNRGYFKDEGIELHIVSYPSGRTALADMARGKNLDIVTCAQTPVMYNSFDHGKYSIVAGIAQSYEAGSRLLARTDRGISTPRDLRGKRIGTPVGSTGHYFLHLFLMYNGLQIHDAKVVDIDAPKLPSALAAGEVDAISVWQPQVYLAQKLLGEKAGVLPAPNIYRVDFYLVAGNEFATRDPEAARRFLKAIARGEEFIAANREASIDIVSTALKADRTTIAALWDLYTFKLFLDQAILSDLEAEGRWALENGFVPAKALPDYRTYIQTPFLESVKPEAVNIIR